MSSHPHLLAIASGKGGTGKTFLATNLALALAREGERVLLFDGDIGLSNVAVQLGLTKPCAFEDVLAGTIAVHEAAQPVLGGAAKRGGFDVLAGAPGTGDTASVSGLAIMRTLAALRLAIGYDRVLIDLGAGIEDIVLRFAAAADETLAVMTSDPSALTDVYAFVKLYARRAQGRMPAFVVNSVANPTKARHTADTLITSCRSFLGAAPTDWGWVRYDPKAAGAIRRQQLLLGGPDKGVAVQDILKLSQRIAADRRAGEVRSAAR